MQVKAVVEQLTEAAKAGREPTKVKLDWEAVDNYALTHEETVQQRAIANSRRFLTDFEYEIETGKTWNEQDHDRKYSRGTYLGQDGVYAIDKLGIQLQDEHVKGMKLANTYDNGGEDTEANEKKNVFAAKRSMVMGYSGESCPAFSASSCAGPQKLGAETAQPTGGAAESTPQKIKSGAEGAQSSASPANIATEGAEQDGQPKGGKGQTKADGDGTENIKAKGKAKPKPKGRPPKSITQDAKDLCQSFLLSAPDDVLWWGAESRTQLKKLRELKKAFDVWIAQAQEEETISTLEPFSKLVSTLVLLTEAQQKCGFGAAGFVEVYDCCLTSLRTSHMLVSVWV